MFGCAAMAVGALFALPSTDEKGRMIFFFLVAMATGLFVGERLVYAIYRKRIEAKQILPARRS